MSVRYTRDIEWHEQCLTNMRNTLIGYRHALAAEQRRVTTLEAEVSLYERQIAEAKERGMTEFDRDRLLRTRKEKRA